MELATCRCGTAMNITRSIFWRSSVKSQCPLSQSKDFRQVLLDLDVRGHKNLIMRTFLYCREELGMDCKKWVSSPHSHICVRSPGASPKKPVCGSDAILQSFWDLDKVVPDDPRFSRLFSIEDAKEIVNFVRVRSGLFIVNCEAGVSRSPAIVMALRQHYGGDVEDVRHRTSPNCRVLDLLGWELEKIGDSGE